MRISDWSSDVCSSDLTFAGAHDHGVIHFALLDLAARNGIFHGHFDDVTDIGVAALGAAEHLDAHQLFGATVVGSLKVALHLDHGSDSSLLTRPRACRLPPHASPWTWPQAHLRHHPPTPL